MKKYVALNNSFVFVGVGTQQMVLQAALNFTQACVITDFIVSVINKTAAGVSSAPNFQASLVLAPPANLGFEVPNGFSTSTGTGVIQQLNVFGMSGYQINIHELSIPVSASGIISVGVFHLNAGVVGETDLSDVVIGFMFPDDVDGNFPAIPYGG